MNKIVIMIVALFLTITQVVNSQTTEKYDSIKTIEKAKYLKEDLNRLLSIGIKYPVEALNKKIQGDVVLSYLITKNGRLEGLTILNSPGLILSKSAIDAINSLEDYWEPAKISGSSIDKKYLSIFRFRTYLNIPPPDYKSKALIYYKKQKYTKALKLFDKAIIDNKYDFELFESRSHIKDILGDIEGSGQDYFSCNKLKNEVISIVTIYEKAIITKSERTVIIRTSIEAVPVLR
jgi:TonB family protein